MLSDLWSDLRHRLRAIFRSGAVDRELDDEVRFHLEREAEKLIRSGLAPEEARRQARLAFGGVERVKQESREGRGISWLQIAAQDLRYAWRTLRGSPGFTAAVVGTLALGIGANAAMFAIVDRLLFRPPTFLDAPDRVHRIYLETTFRGEVTWAQNISYATYLDLERWTSSFDRVGAVFNAELAVGTGDDAKEMRVATVSASLWDFFEAPPALGRYFLPAEDSLPGGTAVTVLSHAFWQSRYGGRSDVLGQQLQIGPLSYTIIGVAPKGFDGPQSVPSVAFIPITSFASSSDFGRDRTGWYQTYGWQWMEMLVRRKPGISPEAATADLTQAYRQSYLAERERHPGTPPPEVARPGVVAAAVQTERGPNQSVTAKVAGWVTGVTAVVLLIACANVANLLLARALSRRREIALRLALGVGRARLFAQLLTESLVLAALGGLAGVAVGQLGRMVLSRLFLPDVPDATSVADWRTFGFIAIATLLTGVLTGLAPILQARRTDVTGALKLGSRSGSFQRSRARDALLLVQGTLSVMLLIGAGLFVRSLDRVRALRLGYDVERVIYVDGRLRGTQLTTEQQAELNRRLYRTALAIPDVESASLTMSVPFWMSRSTSLYVEGIDSVSRIGHISLNAVSPEYFATMGTRLLRGRGITAEDRAGAPRVMVVSEKMGQALWPGQDPIGKCVRVEADTVPCTTVVGVAEGIKNRSITNEHGRQYYLSAEQFRPDEASLLVRTRGPAAEQVENIRRTLQREMPGASYVTATALREIVGPQLRSWELGATMFLAFGALAVALAGVGLYSVVAYNVVQRRQEIGVRIALGASTASLLKLVVREGVRFAAIGVLIGGAAALWAGRWLGPLLFEQAPDDPMIFAGVGVILIAVAAAASAVPALRAARVDPNTALRAD